MRSIKNGKLNGINLSVNGRKEKRAKNWEENQAVNTNLNINGFHLHPQL